MITGCDAVHPGYGFLSEDATFAEACVAHDLTFIGPRPEVLERFARKYAVRRMLAANGLPDRAGQPRASSPTCAMRWSRPVRPGTRSC